MTTQFQLPPLDFQLWSSKPNRNSTISFTEDVLLSLYSESNLKVNNYYSFISF